MGVTLGLLLYEKNIEWEYLRRIFVSTRSEVTGW
jgi:hypothetical protein